MLITQPARPPQAIRLPEPRMPIAIRPGTMDDFAFIDSLQGSHTKQVGWMPKAQLEGKIRVGHVIVAEVPGPLSFVPCGEPGAKAEPTTSDQGQVTSDTRVGFCIGNDQYFKRDDCGIIYQLCVVEGQRRGLIGAALVKAMFERAAWGCKLFCCWCAQDIEANHFWESLGFVPLAFRAGSRKKSRVHIFWQKRIRANDTSTPWWFPAKTDAGALREDRLVLPIPPQLHWSDAMPVLKSEGTEARRHSGTKGKSELVPGMKCGPQTPTPRPRAGVRFGPPGAEPIAQQSPPPEQKAPKAPRQKHKCDPKLLALARELRDRFLDQVNGDPSLLLPSAKYEVARALPAETAPAAFVGVKALPQAA